MKKIVLNIRVVKKFDTEKEYDENVENMKENMDSFVKENTEKTCYASVRATFDDGKKIFSDSKTINQTKPNKFFEVYDKDNDEGLINVVIAQNKKQAKVIGANTEATEGADRWTDLRVRAIKGGSSFWDNYERTVGFEVKGTGFVYTKEKPQLDSFFEILKKELKSQGRYQEVVEDDGTVDS